MSPDQLIILHRHRFVKAVETALRRRCGVRPGQRLIAAVSGGADSTAMLLSLHAIANRPHWSLDLQVAHVHHHLREGADADERFVADLARSLDLPFHRADARPAGRPGNLEANARRDRYTALRRIAEEHEADAIAVAHHADDQLETMLMRLVRGAAPAGLAAMAPRRRLGDRCALIRPMLCTDREHAIALLGELDQPWRRDPTNADLSRWRARLRAEVLPVLRDLRPDAAIKAAHTADRLREAARLLHRLARRADRRHVQRRSPHEAQLARDVARRLPPPVLGALIRRRCRAMGARADALGRRAIDPIVEAVRDPSGETRCFELSGGVRLTVTAEHLRWAGRP